MTGIQDFLESAADMIAEMINEETEEEVKLSYARVVKVNDSTLNGLRMEIKGREAMPVIYLDPLYESYLAGVPFETVMHEAYRAFVMALDAEPREDNGWSYHHARRQWSLRDDPELRFKPLADFDEEMIKCIRDVDGPAVELVANDPDKVLAFKRGKYLFAFNFNPTKSFEGYGILVPPATEWKHLFDTDEVRFGGQGRIGRGAKYGPALVPWRGELVQQIRLYLPARTAVVLNMI